MLSVIRKYPKHQIHLHIRHDGHRDLQKSVQRRLSEGPKQFTRCGGGGGLVFRTSVQHHYLKDLYIYRCTNLLREVDLRNLPNLRSFTMQKCRRAVVTGWKYVTKLEWLRLKEYIRVSPDIKHLSSLKYLHLEFNHNDRGANWDWTNIIEGCQLESLRISDGHSLYNYGRIGRWAKLRSLSVYNTLGFNCSYLQPIISVAHSLIELSFHGCYFDRTEDDPEFRADLSALRHLSSLDLSCTRYFWHNGTHGVEELENLTFLNCWGSDLKDLPDLSHLNKLRCVNLEGTPFVKKLGSCDLPEWLSKVWEETFLTETDLYDSPASDIFYESECESASASDSES